MNKKLLTVIVPCYNMEAYLSKCLASLIVSEDVLDKLDVVVVNDGSIDRTSEIAHGFENRYPICFRVVDKPNGHYGSCINAGLNLATGAYVKILDSDDAFDTKALTEFLRYLPDALNDRVDMILTDWDGFYSNGEITNVHSFNLPSDRLLDTTMMPPPRSTYVGQVSLTVRTENIRKLGYKQTEGIPHTDAEWFTLLWANVHTIRYWPRVIYRVFHGRPGQSMEARTYLRNFPAVKKVTINILEKFSAFEEKLSPQERSFLLEKVMFMVDHVYELAFKGFGGVIEPLYVKDFEVKICERWPEVFALSCCKLKFLAFNVDILRVQRFCPVLAEFLLLIYRFYRRVRSMLGKLRRWRFKK